MFNRLYNDSYDDFAMISIAWSWSSCKDNLSAFFIKNTVQIEVVNVNSMWWQRSIKAYDISNWSTS